MRAGVARSKPGPGSDRRRRDRVGVYALNENGMREWISQLMVQPGQEAT